MTYTLTAERANGAYILNSNLKQDAKVSYAEMLKAVQVKFPTAKWCLPFRTFDGDAISCIQIPDPLMGFTRNITPGAKMEF